MLEKIGSITDRDRRFLADIRHARMSPQDFTHQSHLRMAWLYIKLYGYEAAVDRMIIDLANFVCEVGAVDKFDLVLTKRAMTIINEMIESGEEDTFEQFIAAHPVLITDFKTTLEYC